jgi:hypothetical protein
MAVFRNLGDLDSLNLDLDALTGDIMFPFQTHIAEIKVRSNFYYLIKRSDLDQTKC